MVHYFSEVRTADALTIISCIMSALGVGAIVSGVISRRLIKAERAAEEKEEARAEEMILLLTGVKAAGALSYATAVAIKRGYANGEVEKGVQEYTAWEKELDKFLIKQTSKN